MSQLTDRIRQHPVFEEFSALGAVVDRAAGRWGIDAAALASIERLRSVLSYCGKRVAAADPDLVDPRSLTAISKALSVVKTELEAYLSDSAPSHLEGAHVQADEALVAVSAVPAAAAPDDLTWINEATGAFRSTVERHLAETLTKHAEIYKANEGNRGAIEQVAAEVSATKEKLTTVLSEQQTQFSSAQDGRASEFATAQADRQTKNAAVVSELQTAFSTAQSERLAQFTASSTAAQTDFASAQESRSKEFTAAQAERATSYAGLSAEYATALGEHNKELIRLREAAIKASAEALTALRVGYEDAAKGILQTIETHKAQVEKLVGVIGDLGVTSGYQKTANRAQKAAYLWQFLTVAALGGLIFFAYIIAFAPPISDALLLQGLSTRIFLSLTVGVFAAYAAKQASNSLDMERRARKLALELEALGPFLAPLPQEMQNKFRVELGDRSFGIPDGDQNKVTEKDPVMATDLLPLLRDALSKLAK